MEPNDITPVVPVTNAEILALLKERYMYTEQNICPTCMPTVTREQIRDFITPNSFIPLEFLFQEQSIQDGIQLPRIVVKWLPYRYTPDYILYKVAVNEEVIGSGTFFLLPPKE